MTERGPRNWIGLTHQLMRGSAVLTAWNIGFFGILNRCEWAEFPGLGRFAVDPVGIHSFD